uniref:Prolyl 4-hydroxylase alpha subunit domain-containing protein n=1 Tax=Chaetoceros debilis TaxID=122233 RepID=A0A7S3PYD2_9STRA
MMNCISPLAVLLLLASANAFAPNFIHQRTPLLVGVPKVTVTDTQLDAKKKDMAQKRKKRGQKFMPKKMERPAALSEVPAADDWGGKTQSTEEKVETMKKGEDEVKQQAAALIATQRDSVDALTLVRKQIESLPVDEMGTAFASSSHAVFDDVLGDDMASKMRSEAQSMFDNNKLELDIGAGLTSAEYASAIKGGQDQYLDCPRSIEYVVSMTRHLSAMINKSGEGSDESKSLGFRLDEAASMAGVRFFDRKARMSSLALLLGKTAEELEESHDNSDLNKKEFGFVVSEDGKIDDGKNDLRRLSVLYFTTPDGWDEECGGGITFEKDGKEVSVAAKNDRLVLFSSDKCSHRMEPWVGANREGGESGSVVITHLVRYSR